MATRAELRAQIQTLKAQVTGLTAEIDALAVQQAQYRATEDALDSQVSALQTDITIATADVEGLTVQRDNLAAEVAALQAALAACQQTTLFGVTVDGAVRRSMPDLHDEVEISRVFSAGTTSWGAEDQHTKFPNGMWACSNSYDLSEANLPRLLDSIPAADRANIVAWADGHELENPDKGLTGSQVRARQARTAPIIRARGLRTASCLMAWTLNPKSGRQWRDWIDPDSIDLLAWDAYNGGSKSNPPTYTDPDLILARIIDAATELGKPWALWETGSDVFDTNWTRRAAWATALREAVIAEGGEHAIWFDRKATDPNSDWTAELDRQSAEAWLLG